LDSITIEQVMQCSIFGPCSRDDVIRWIKKRREQYEQRMQEQAREDYHKRLLEHVGSKTGGMTIAQAKIYARSRATNKLRSAFEFLEDVVDGKIAVNLKDRLDASYEIIKRAAGNHAVLNAIPDPQKVAALAPVDAIDTVMQAYGNGLVDETFVKTMLGLLGAKVNGLRLEQESDKKSTKKVLDKIDKPPSGKIV